MDGYIDLKRNSIKYLVDCNIFCKMQYILEHDILANGFRFLENVTTVICNTSFNIQSKQHFCE